MDSRQRQEALTRSRAAVAGIIGELEVAFGATAAYPVTSHLLASHGEMRKLGELLATEQVEMAGGAA